MCKQSEFYSVIVLNFGTSEKFVSYYLLSDNANRSWQLCVYACVLEQNILLTAYSQCEDSMGIKMMSTIASHSPLNIWETVRVESWFRRTPIGNGLGKSNNHVTDDVT